MESDFEPANSLDAAYRAIAYGGIAIFPTDTFYALGTDALDAAAVTKIFKLKGRNERQPMPVLVPSVDSIRDLCRSIPSIAYELATRFWPGALTMVLPRSDRVPRAVTGGGDTVGVRMPNHETALEILRRLGGPITGTSANPSGTPPTKEIAQVRKWFNSSGVAIVDAPCGPHEVPSTVLDLTNIPPIVIRIGGVSLDEIRKLVPDVTVSPAR